MKQPWLDPDEQGKVIAHLAERGLMRWDNRRNLPLKSGGTTDVCINLRDARNDPDSIDFISRHFSRALNRLDLDRFVEVPDSVSCFAGCISLKTGLPYATIRESPKEGRVAKAKIIGTLDRGDRVAIFDDVITDGASKIAPYLECVSAGAKMAPLVVLVDRQQGWKKKLAEAGISLEVWPGMTLHDVRRYLIEKGLMQRCDPKVEEKNPIILALDGKSWDDLLPLIDPLRTSGCILKANDLMIAKGTEWLLPNLSVYGRVMADLKGHDISNTLGNISRHLLACPPWAVTVHASGGAEMISKVVETLRGTATLVLAVTVLTSFDQKTCEEIFTRVPPEQVAKLAEIAHQAGAHGFVCSPEEVAFLRDKYPEAILVTPGVRSPGEDKRDQKRVATPAEAVGRGADYIVMGGQILSKADPIREINRVLSEELEIAL